MQATKSDLGKKFWEDEKWTREHYQDFIKKYPDMWIAVVNKKVVSWGDSISKIKEIAQKKTARKKIPILFVEGSVHVY